MKTILKILIYFVILLSLIAGSVVFVINNFEATAVNYLVRSLIEFKLSSSKYKVSIKGCSIQKIDNGFQKITFNNLQINKLEAGTYKDIGSAKIIEISLNTKELFKLQYVPIDINVDRFNFELSKDPNEIGEVTQGVFENLISIIKSQLFWVGSINITHSKLGFDMGDRTRFFDISEANMEVNKAQKKIKLDVAYILSNKTHNFVLDLSLVKNRYLNILANLNDLPAHLPISQLSGSAFKNLQHAANELLISGSIFHSYDAKKKTHTSIINLAKFSGTLHSMYEEGKYLKIKPSKCNIEILEDYDKLRMSDCSIHFGENSAIAFDVALNKRDNLFKLFEFTGSLNNLPVDVINYITSPDNPGSVKEFLTEYITQGSLSTGKWKIRLDKHFFKNKSLATSELKGNFDLKDVGFKYEGGHPVISIFSTEAIIDGDEIKFANINGKVERSNIIDSKVSFDWQNMFHKGIDVDCKTHGPVGDYIKYIEKDQIADLKSKGVDLNTLEGIADTAIKVHVPLSPNEKVTVKVDISSQDFGMKFLSDTLHLHNTNIKGLLAEDKLTLNGKGLVNGLESEISFEHNLNSSDGFQDILKADISLSPALEKNDFFSIKRGEAQLKVNYKSKDNNGFWNIESDLTNLDLYIDKLGLIKPLGKTSSLKFMSSSTFNKDEPAKFEFLSNNGIDISGTAHTKGDMTNIILDRFNYGKTKLKATIDFSSQNQIYKISGSSFDLSAADFSKLFSSGKRATNTSYNVNINKIYLKNNLELRSFKLDMKCDKETCYKGYMNSYFDDTPRFFDMLLTDYKSYAECTVTTNNAGALFRGLGIYDNVRGGAMVLRLNTTRVVDRKDHIHSVSTYGDMNLSRFATIKTPFMTRLVSFISLPGFMGTITRQNQILFSEFKSKFEVSDGVIKISDGAAEGPYFDFNIRGRVDTNKRLYELKGEVIPSLYGISTLVKKLPIIGKILSGGRRKGLIFAPYVIRDKY